jgi:D-tyrosyl-tRNA(Tyr) deacylase
MKFIIQRVLSAVVFAGDTVICRIEQGLLCFVGFHKNDKDGDADWIGKKALSIFYWDSDAAVPWKKGVAEVQASVIVIPEPGLIACVDFDDRPNFDDVMPPELASQLYDKLIVKMKAAYVPDKVFGVPFDIPKRLDFVNDGPVTIGLDSFHRRD